MTLPAWICAALTLAGLAQCLPGAWLIWRFVRRGPGETIASAPITILKPLHGGEPLLAEALASLCEQDYAPGFQIVFGVGEASDSAIPIVRDIQNRYPAADIALVVEGARHGSNPKVCNLINMFPIAKHDILVIADSDVHARPGYLADMADCLSRPGVGLVTVLYTGLPAYPGLAGVMGATQITHGFLPGALLARVLGRQDCLGATMALTRETLGRVGGLEALKDHLADDNVLGRRVRALGLDVALARTVVATTVPETELAALWRHELRWARTVRTLEPLGHAVSILQYPLFWAIMTLSLSGFALWSILLFLLAWAGRAGAAMMIDRALAPVLGGLAFPCSVWLLPLRELLSVVEWAASHAGRRVDWRGLTLRADTPPRPTTLKPSDTSFPAAALSAPDHDKGSHAR